MPTTREEREAQLLQRKGIDPSKFTISADGAVVARTPAASPVVEEPPGVVETMLRSAVGAIPETVGGLAGGGLGVAGGTAVAPSLGPLAPAAPFVGGLGGSVAGSMAASAIENELAKRTEMGKSWQNWTGKGARENSIAAEIGAALPQLLTANPRGAIQGMAALSKAVPTLTRFTPMQLAQLGNIGIGVGVGSGSALAEDLLGGDLNLDTAKKAAIRGAAGLLGSEQNALGRKFTRQPAFRDTDRWHKGPAVARDAVQKTSRAMPSDAEAFAKARVVQDDPIPLKPRGLDSATVDVQSADSVGSQAATDAAFAANAKQLPEQTQPASDLLGTTTPEWDKLISDVGAKSYASDVQTGVPGLRSSETGLPVAGRVELPSDLERALVQISKNAGIDTGPHELLHVILNDVKARGTPGEQRFVNRAFEGAGGEEALVQGGGQEFVRRLIGEKNNASSPLLGDLASFIKARYLGRGTARDYERLAANTLRHGADSTQYRPDAPPPVIPKTEGENSPKKPSDREVREQPLGVRESYTGDEPPRNALSDRLDPFMSPVRRLEKHPDSRRQLAGDLFRRLQSRRDEMRGRYSDVLRTIEKNTGPDADEAYRAMIERDRTGVAPGPMSTAKAQEVYDTMDRVYRDMRMDQIAAGHLVDGRTAGVDPTGMFNTLDPQAFETLVTGQGSPRWNQMRQEFIDLNTSRGIKPADAEAAFARYVENVAHESSPDMAVDFRAVSMPEGFKIPDGWVDPNAFNAWRKYIDKFTTARTWHDMVQASPDHKALFEGEMSLAKDPDVADAFGDFAGRTSRTNPKLSAAGSIVNSMILGPVTRVVDIATTPIKALGYAPIESLPRMVSELGNIKQHYENSFKTGFNRPGGEMVVKDIAGATERTAAGARSLSKFLSKWQGLEYLEKAGRGVAQLMGSTIGDVQRQKARAGDAKAVEFLSKLGSDWDTISSEELGTRIGRLFQGNYSSVNLPTWVRDSQVAPFMSLARWSVEQSNNFRQFAIEPAAKGDYVPLMKMLAAGLVGGSGVAQIRELMTGKKPYVAEIEEIKNAPDKDRAMQEAAYKIGHALQVVGTLGAAGDLLMMPMQVATGKFANSYSYPVYEFAKDAGVRGVKALQAIFSGVPADLVAKQALEDFAKRNIQVSQILTRNSDSREQSNAARDYKMFRRLSGKNDPIPQGTIDYSRAVERDLDRETDPAEARTKAAAARAEVEKLPTMEAKMQAMRRLTNNRSAWLPANPAERERYLDFVTRTQGQEKARKLVEAYERELEVRRAKQEGLMTVP